MKLFRSSSAAMSPTSTPAAVVVAVVVVVVAVASSHSFPSTLAFVTKTPFSSRAYTKTNTKTNTPPPLEFRFQSEFQSEFQSKFEFQSETTRRRRRQVRIGVALASSRQEDIEDRIVSYKNSWNENVLRSDIPSDDDSNNNSNNNSNSKNNNGIRNTLRRLKSAKDKYWKLPPQPEDQFIMTGDIFTLFLYAFTSHSINDAVVRGLLDDPKMTIPEAVRELDPLHDTVQLQHPVWVDLTSNPNVPFGNPAVDHALEVSARESLLNHWGPLLSTEGTACVALCTCWLIAGWLHRSFHFQNSTYCASHRALLKTVETWVTAALLLAWCAAGTDALVTVSGAGAGIATVTALTQSDVLFVIDSLTVLLAWRWSAHRILNTFR